MDRLLLLITDARPKATRELHERIREVAPFAVQLSQCAELSTPEQAKALAQRSEHEVIAAAAKRWCKEPTRPCTRPRRRGGTGSSSTSTPA
ncbi:MAG: hypothetical protein HYZ28_06755 [Myxococcales bacterium]|nr:hypothetical protein [Myxococcales bacterium]